MEYINTTPHQINVFGEDGTLLFLLRPALDVRASTQETIVSCENRVLITKQVLGEPAIKNLHGELIAMEDLPLEGLVVSLIAASSLRAAGFAGQLLTPNTAPGRVIRDESGRILGCTGFVQQP